MRNENGTKFLHFYNKQDNKNKKESYKVVKLLLVKLTSYLYFIELFFKGD